MKKKNQGITLVALVVTIIVLLILAAVSMNLVLGQNGIITRARSASKETKKAGDKEEKNLDELATILGQYAPVKKSTDSNPGTMAGSGSTADPYLIESIEDLVKFQQDVNGGNDFTGKTIKLGLSLDFKADDSYIDPHSTAFGDINGDGRIDEIKTELTTSKGWMPVGSITAAFKGDYDGGSNQILNLYIDRKSTEKKTVASGKAESYFGFIANSEGTISNLALSGDIRIDMENQDTMMEASVGSLGACTGANSKIEKIMNNVNITIYESQPSNSDVRANIGGITSTVKDVYSCINNGNITVNIQNATYPISMFTGGITQVLFGNMIDAVNNGKIVVKDVGQSYTGGLIGSLINDEGSKIENVINNGEVNVQQGSLPYPSMVADVGGIVAAKGSATDIDKAINRGKLVFNRKELGTGTTVQMGQGIIGGIAAGCLGGKITNSINEGEMVFTSATKFQGYVGGIIADAGPDGTNTTTWTVENVINKGNIKVVDTCNSTESSHYIQAGGIIARYEWFQGPMSEIAYLNNAYNQGNIDVTCPLTNTVVGGVVGRSFLSINCKNVMDKGNITIPDANVGYRGFITGNKDAGVVTADGMFIDNGLTYSGSARPGSPADSAATKMDMTPKNVADKMNSTLNSGDATWKVNNESVTLDF